MDSITQAALGAAVGEAVLGKKVGWRAAVWGAFFGTLPDLDVFAGPFLSEPQNLMFHRGPTHALVFAFVVAPVFGWLLARLHRSTGASWKQWGWLAFWAIFTHPLLDAFTAYGTQNFWPFTRYPVAFSTISIIDPLYTVPLLIGLVAALWMKRGTLRRRRANYAGLIISSVYLALTGVNKLYVDSVFRASLEEQNIEYTTLFSSPTLFNNLLWSVLADDGETVWYGLYSILDDEPQITFTPVSKNAERLSGWEDQEAVEVILWFSRGLYTVREQNGSIYVHDMHVGRSDMWMDPDGAYIFVFRLVPDPQNPDRILTFEQGNPFADRRLDGAFFRQFWNRIRGVRNSDFGLRSGCPEHKIPHLLTSTFGFALRIPHST